MRTLAVAVLIALSASVGLIRAQQQSDADRRKIADFIRQRLIEQQRERDRELKTSCPLPDGSNQSLNTVTSYEGQTYRCVEVLRSDGFTLTTYAAAWVKVPLSN